MNLLLVDDQPNVLASLLSAINWQEIGISDVYAASSVLTAKEILRSKQIQILVTDIEMPVESGLSLIRWIREAGMQIECILLTSHADFFYAKQAIALEVFEYIVQPAKKEDILRAVENAQMRIYRRLEVEHLTKLNETTSNLQNAIIRQMFEQWPDNPSKHDAGDGLEQCIRQINDLGIACTPNSQILLMGVYITRWFTLPLPPLDLLPRYQKYLAEFLAFLRGDALSYCSKHNCFISAVFSEGSWNYEEYLRIFQKSISEKLRGSARIYYSVAPSREIAAALAALYGNLEDAQTDIHAKDEEPVIYVPFQSQSDAPPRASSNIGNYFCSIEAYIDRNIASPITRMQIADHLHLSPDYVSHIVRISADCSCKELILKKKMSLARQLLRTTNLPVGEVAQRCGYDNFAYFSRVYKSYYNTIPSSERT